MGQVATDPDQVTLRPKVTLGILEPPGGSHPTLGAPRDRQLVTESPTSRGHLLAHLTNESTHLTTLVEWNDFGCKMVGKRRDIE